jgi:hypothetical protein
MSLRYVPHIIYSLALTSFAMHLLYQRRDAEEDRSRLSAKISILESLAGRLEKGERIDPTEVTRLRKLAGLLDSSKQETNKEEKISWRDVLFGRREHPGAVGTVSWDKKDWEKGTELPTFSFRS